MARRIEAEAAGAPGAETTGNAIVAVGARIRFWAAPDGAGTAGEWEWPEFLAAQHGMEPPCRQQARTGDLPHAGNVPANTGIAARSKLKKMARADFTIQ